MMELLINENKPNMLCYVMNMGRREYMGNGKDDLYEMSHTCTHTHTTSTHTHTTRISGSQTPHKNTIYSSVFVFKYTYMHIR